MVSDVVTIMTSGDVSEAESIGKWTSQELMGIDEEDRLEGCAKDKMKLQAI